MAWEWIVPIAITIIAPTVFHRFAPTRQETTVLGGAVFTLNYGPVTRVLRTTFKFAFAWAMALLLARLDNRLWLKIWVVLLLVPLMVHLFFAQRYRVHWLTGKPL